MAAGVDTVQQGLEIVSLLPEEVHWLCPTIEPGPGGVVSGCDQDATARSNATMHALMLFSFTEQEETQLWLKARLGAQLARCRRCVEEFYRLKRSFYYLLAEEHGSDSVDRFFEYLQEWDIERVTPVVREALVMLSRAGKDYDAWYDSLKKDVRLLNSIHECLCSPGLLRSDELKEYMQQICVSGKIYIEGPSAGLVDFLFRPEPIFRSLAKKSWVLIGPKLTPTIFEANLSESLVKVIQHAENEADPSSFFRGLAAIVASIDKDVIRRCVCGAKRDPLKLAVSRLQPNSSYLPSLLRLFTALMDKMKHEFWDVVVPMTSSALPELVFGDPMYWSLLRSTEQRSDGEAQLLDLTEWISSYVNTVTNLHRPTTAHTLLRNLSNGDLPVLSKALFLKEGMEVLSSTLSAVLSGLSSLKSDGDVAIFRQANDLLSEHLRNVGDVASSANRFEDELMAKHMSFAQTAAMDTCFYAVQLHIKLLLSNYISLAPQKDFEKPSLMADARSSLWRVIYEQIPLDDHSVARRTLEIIKPLFDVEALRFYDKEKAKDPLRSEKEHFNDVFKSTNSDLLKLLQRFSGLSTSTYGRLFEHSSACEVIFRGWCSRYDEMSMVAQDVMLRASGADDKEGAIRWMVKSDINITLNSLNSFGRSLAKSGLFAPMPKWTKLNMIMLDVLCDRTDGFIRTTMLEEWQKTSLRVYWEIQWKCLGYTFRRSRKWAMFEGKDIMTEFLRDAMDYAEDLFDNYWTYEQGLRATAEDAEGRDRAQSWGNRLLLDASKALAPFANILTIQDSHLLMKCAVFMKRVLELLDREKIPFTDEQFFIFMRKTLFPESEPNYDSQRGPVTNLSEVQKAELSMAVKRLRPDFVPAPIKKETRVIDISDDEYGSLSDTDMLKALDKAEPTKLRQQTLKFPLSTATSTAPRPSSALPIKPKQNDDKRKEFLEKRRKDKAALEARNAALLGTKPKPPQVLSSDESSSDEEGGLGLFKRCNRETNEDAATTAKPKRKLHSNRPVAQIRIKDSRARTAADLSPLYKQIFKWDFLRDDEFPPDCHREVYTHVASSFKNHESYMKTYEPLLLLEAWQGFLKCKEEMSSNTPYEVKISSRMRADDFVELQITAEQMQRGDRNRWMESDIVLLSPNSKPLKAANEPHCIARVNSTSLKMGSYELTLRCDPPSNMLQQHMRNGGTLHGVKIMSLTPLEREYTALKNLQYYDLRDEIFTAKPAPLHKPTEDKIKRTCNLYNLNEPQARAVLSSIANSGFTLIQGPPGTGKTKTVVGIVGALITGPSQVIQIPSTTSTGKPGATYSKKKLLVCAPSNAAVDELVMRLKAGVKTTTNETITPKIVRIGRSDAINEEVRDVTLEELIEARMAPAAEANKGKGNELEELRKSHGENCEKRNAMQKQLEDARTRKIEPPTTLQVDLDNLNRTLWQQRKQLDNLKDHRKESYRNAEVLRRRVQQEIMDEAQIICATLSGSGHDMLRNVNVDFETVIIDEAAQSVELSALIPLKFGCEKCILVGDPRQLPPTVLSKQAAKFSYEKSLFVRMQENSPKDVHLLSIQYRMHPQISIFPSKQFYNSELVDGPNMADLRKQPWHKSDVFGPYRFFNVRGQEFKHKTSLVNRDEAKTALSLYRKLVADYGNIFAGKIGIVTPYRQQLGTLKQIFEQALGQGILKAIEFNTVDAFQGREREIIIFSCVRAAQEGGIGFLADVRRMNVGLTRAKSSLFVLGHSDVLVKNHLWRQLIEDAKARDVFVDNSSFVFNQPVNKTAPPPKPRIALLDGDGDTIMGGDSPKRPAEKLVRPQPRSGPLGRLEPSASATDSSANARPIYGNRSVPTGPREATKPENRAPRACHLCGQVGHIQRDCSRLQCHECKQSGHKKYECPNLKRKAGHENAQRGIKRARNEDEAGDHDMGIGHDVKRMHINSRDHTPIPPNQQQAEGIDIPGQGTGPSGLQASLGPQGQKKKKKQKKNEPVNPFIPKSSGANPKPKPGGPKPGAATGKPPPPTPSFGANPFANF